MKNYIFLSYSFSIKVIWELELFEIILNTFLDGIEHNWARQKELANNRVYNKTLSCLRFKAMEQTKFLLKKLLGMQCQWSFMFKTRHLCMLRNRDNIMISITCQVTSNIWSRKIVKKLSECCSERWTVRGREGKEYLEDVRLKANPPAIDVILWWP